MKQDPKPVLPCRRGHKRTMPPGGGITYVLSARAAGINPWCGCRLVDCPEPTR